MKLRDMGDGITRVLMLIEDPDDTHDTAVVAYLRRVPKRVRRLPVEHGLPRSR